MLLGKKTSYPNKYNPGFIVTIPREGKRLAVGIASNDLPFTGFDIWNAYEISWLNKKGKPEVAIGRFIIPCETASIIESKSLKLYLNSFNNSHFESLNAVTATIQNDLNTALNSKIAVELYNYNDYNLKQFSDLGGVCIDDIDIDIDKYQVNPDYLNANSDEIVTESLYSNLLKSNCLVTKQPDWATVAIEYKGPKIDRANLLKYLISYRNHDEFHEQCVERVFSDIKKYCNPTELTVTAYYTRRGGIDINPLRTNANLDLTNPKLFRHIRQ